MTSFCILSPGQNIRGYYIPTYSITAHPPVLSPSRQGVFSLIPTRINNYNYNVRFVQSSNPWCAYNPSYLSRIGKVADPTIHTPRIPFVVDATILGDSIISARALVLESSTTHTTTHVSAGNKQDQARRKGKMAHIRTLPYVWRCSTAEGPPSVRLHLPSAFRY